MVGDGSKLIGKSGDVREAAVMETDINQDIVKRYGAEALNDPNTRKAWELRGQLANYQKSYGNVTRSQQSLDQERNIRNELARVEGEIEKARVKAESERAKTAPSRTAPSPAPSPSGDSATRSGRSTGGGVSSGAPAPARDRIVNINLGIGRRSFPVPTNGVGEQNLQGLADEVLSVLEEGKRRTGR